MADRDRRELDVVLHDELMRSQIRRRVTGAVGDVVDDEQLGGRDEHVERVLEIVEKAKRIGREPSS